MGNVQRPPHVVELRLDYPEVATPRAFFARVHSEAHGSSKYRAWGEPQALRLWADDIIAITICTAETREEFEKSHYQDVGDLYIPWSLISGQVTESMEVVFTLGFVQGAGCLGHNASLARYVDAFYRAYGIAEENPSAPHIRIGIRFVSSTAGTEAQPGSCVVGSSHVVTSGIQELTGEEMRRLLQLQVRNKELHLQLGLAEGCGPPVEEQVREHVESVRQAVSQNYSLRAEQQSVDQELAATNASLTQEQRLMVTNDASGRDGQTPHDEQLHEVRASQVMDAIQSITKRNIELLSQFDNDAKALEEELARARQQRSEAELAGDAALREREAAQRDASSSVARRLQQLNQTLRSIQEECEGLEAELVQEFAEDPSVAEDPSLIEGLHQTNRMQQAEIERLRSRLEPVDVPPQLGELHQMRQSFSQEQLASEELTRGLRQELLVLQEELQFTEDAKLDAEHQLEEMRRGHEAVSTQERERAEEQMLKDSLVKEITRSQRRVEVCDEKIQRLKEEASDICERATLALQAVPDTTGPPGGDSLSSNHFTGLEMQVQQYREELQLARRMEEELRKEREMTQRALQAAKVEAAVTEQKMRLLRTRSFED